MEREAPASSFDPGGVLTDLCPSGTQAAINQKLPSIPQAFFKLLVLPSTSGAVCPAVLLGQGLGFLSPAQSPRAKLLTFKSPDVKSRWLRTQAIRPLRISQPNAPETCLPRGLRRCAGLLPPPAAPPSLARGPPLRGSYLLRCGLLSMSGRGKSVLPAIRLLSELFMPMLVLPGDDASRAEPEVLLLRHLPSSLCSRPERSGSAQGQPLDGAHARKMRPGGCLEDFWSRP